MNTFKFACPSCRQHIEVGPDAPGHHAECPACKTKVVIPAPPEVAGLVPIAKWVNPPPEKPAPEGTAPKPETSAASPPQQAPAPVPGEKAPPAKPEAPKPEPETDNPFATPSPTIGKSPAEPAELVPQSETRIAAVSPRVKVEIVRSVRSRIEDKSKWLPGKIGASEYAYAGKEENGKLVPVPYASVEATHFSIFGAVLLEFHLRNVINTATGRREFLDDDLLQAIQEVLKREPGGVASDERERAPLTHEQCLAVLDTLEGRFSEAAEKSKLEHVALKLEHIRIGDLVRKLEKKAPVKPEEVATALYYELEALNKRIAALERNLKKPQ